MKLSKKQRRKMVQNHYSELMDQKMQHAARVSKYSRQIADKLKKHKSFYTDWPLLHSAAELHDIAKFDNNKTHHEKAKKVIAAEYKKLTGNKIDKQELNRVAAVIKAHKGKKFDPPEGVVNESAILRMADKIDQVAQKGDKAKKSYRKHLRKIKKSKLFGKKDFKRFKKACKKIRRQAERQS